MCKCEHCISQHEQVALDSWCRINLVTFRERNHKLTVEGGNYASHKVLHFQDVVSCVIVICNCNLFAFHKSRLGYNPEDMDIVSYILSNII